MNTLTNQLQTLFSILFGIFFATTAAASSRFSPFDSSAAVAGDRRALRRLLMSFLLLDAAPFAYFVGVLYFLAGDQRRLPEAVGPSIGVLFAALGAFGIFRIFGAVMFIRRKDDDPKSDETTRRYVFYSREEELGKIYSPVPKPPGIRDSRHATIGAGIWMSVCVVVFALLRYC